MLVYIAFRFEWIYGVAAVIAVFPRYDHHIGLFSLFNKEISLTVVAALLTLVGYSMNDTIVIFDRIRENLKMMRREPLEALINISVNQTLSRTVLTSRPDVPDGARRCFCSAARCCTASRSRWCVELSSGRIRRFSSPVRSWCSGRTSWIAQEGRRRCSGQRAGQGSRREQGGTRKAVRSWPSGSGQGKGVMDMFEQTFVDGDGKDHGRAGRYSYRSSIQVADRHRAAF